MTVININREPLVRPEVVAEYLGVTDKTVILWAKKHGLPGRQVGYRGVWRFRMSEVCAWSESKSVIMRGSGVGSTGQSLHATGERV